MALSEYVVGADVPFTTTYRVNGVETVPDALDLVIVAPSGTRVTKAKAQLTLTGTSTYTWLQEVDETGEWWAQFEAQKAGVPDVVDQVGVYVKPSI